MVTVSCAVCAAPFQVKPYRIERTKHLCCSPHCAGVLNASARFGAAQTRERSGKQNPNWQGGTVPVICEVCGKTFERKPYETKRSKHQFCSMACVGVWKSRHQRGDNHGGYKGGPPEHVCAWCGKVFHRFYAKNVGTIARCCSRTCQAAWQAKNLVGANCGAWRGGNSVDYYGPNWHAQKRAARKRDGYKCQHCGKPQKKCKRALDVHHIKPFKTFGYMPNENDAYLQANDLTNLVSLCIDCHKKAEWNKIAIQPYLL